MFFSMARLSLMAATLFLPIYVRAVVFSVDSFEGIAVGKPINLTWLGDKNPVTIKLMQGDPQALEPVVTLASNVAGESYTWTPTTIPAGTYVLSITQRTETNYSPQFPIANTFGPAPPASVGTKPSTKAATGVVAPAVTPPGAPGYPLPPVAIAAYNPPAGDNSGSKIVCASDASAAFPCYSSVKLTLGHYQSSNGGVGQTDMAISAAVVGITFAVMLML